jgi:diacylglycerol kinase (ATP)
MSDMDNQPRSPAFHKEKGIRHLFAAARYSRQGLERLWLESAFRHEVLAFGAGLLLLALIGVPLLHYVVFVVLMFLLFAIEALNTAIEELVDRISPEISSVGRHAKDLGSFAVFCLLTANGAFVLYSVVATLFL